MIITGLLISLHLEGAATVETKNFYVYDVAGVIELGKPIDIERKSIQETQVFSVDDIDKIEPEDLKLSPKIMAQGIALGIMEIASIIIKSNASLGNISIKASASSTTATEAYVFQLKISNYQLTKQRKILPQQSFCHTFQAKHDLDGSSTLERLNKDSSSTLSGSWNYLNDDDANQLLSIYQQHVIQSIHYGSGYELNFYFLFKNEKAFSDFKSQVDLPLEEKARADAVLEKSCSLFSREVQVVVIPYIFGLRLDSEVIKLLSSPIYHPENLEKSKGIIKSLAERLSAIHVSSTENNVVPIVITCTPYGQFNEGSVLSKVLAKARKRQESNKDNKKVQKKYDKRKF